MPTRKFIEDPTRSKPAPVAFAGQWVAWNPEQTEIVAHALRLDDAMNAARAAGAAGRPDALMQKVRDPHEIRIRLPWTGRRISSATDEPAKSPSG